MSAPSGTQKEIIAHDWLPRYTGTAVEEFGDYVLLTNFKTYVESFESLCIIGMCRRPFYFLHHLLYFVRFGARWSPYKISN